jgi:hypothetical protein
MTEDLSVEDLVDSTKSLRTADKLIFRRLWKLRDTETGAVKTTLAAISRFLKIHRKTVQISIARPIEKGFLIYDKTVIDPGLPYHKRIYRFPETFPTSNAPINSQTLIQPDANK